MTTRSFMPLFAAGIFVLGACALEKPPAKLKFPDGKESAAAPAAAAPAAAPAAEAAPADPKIAAGKGVYDANCAGCHDAGMMGAPKPGDKAGWAARIPQGVETMTKKAITGYQGKAGMMPAKGGNAKLTDAEVGSAVAFMVEKSK
ncbi:MAG: c-type cytochrome [Chlorobiaceae bacterium]